MPWFPRAGTGGGYWQAAGCTIAGSAAEVVAGLREVLERAPLL
ncbi:hypothetical protein [Amycolatopsis rifamycinica]|nr:hypothetical protein [Amycolatopsis rifamycinica]